MEKLRASPGAVVGDGQLFFILTGEWACARSTAETSDALLCAARSVVWNEARLWTGGRTERRQLKDERKWR